MSVEIRIKILNEKLTERRGRYRWRSYLARRIAIVGGFYFVLFFPLLLIQQYWKIDAAALQSQTLNVHLTGALSTWVLSPWVQTFAIIALLALCAGEVKKDWRSKLMSNLIVLAVVIPVLWGLTDHTSTVLVRACHGLLLLGGGTLINRTFGYTRIWARECFYIERLQALENRMFEKDAEKIDAFEKLYEAYCVDQHRDLVGDTFFLLDQATTRFQGK